jgi:hypothetical protein
MVITRPWEPRAHGGQPRIYVVDFAAFWSPLSPSAFIASVEWKSEIFQMEKEALNITVRGGYKRLWLGSLSFFYKI